MDIYLTIIVTGIAYNGAFLHGSEMLLTNYILATSCRDEDVPNTTCLMHAHDTITIQDGF